MSQLPVDGVRLVLQDERQFIAGLGRVNAAWAKTTQQFASSESDFSKFTSGMVKGGAEAMGLKSTLAVLAGGAAAMGAAIGAAAVQVGQTFVNAVQKATNSVVGLITEGMQLAGLFQEMEFAALATGRTMGMSEEEIRTNVDAINDLNIRYDVAAKSVAQMARNQIDMSKSTDLVRIAQGAAVLIQEDSSEALERLIWAATTHNTMMLRRMGIMTDLVDAEERFAASLGKTRDKLTEAQLVQADVNAIIKAGSSLLGVYDAAMESPTKRLRSLTGRILPEFKAALGAPFLDAWSTAIKAISNFVEALGDALSEGGSLYPMMINLGAAASILADGFASALNKITELITGVSQDAATGIGQTIEQALRWGVELVAAFAEGIVEATTTVLVVAMNAVSDMLTSWLLGGSPPKVAPNIVQWGIALMQQYLEGMTQADFGVLKDVQGPLKKILEGPEFANISKALAGALAGGDRGTFLATVEKVAGVFGESLRQLADLNFQLADSVDAVRTAEEALERARDKALSSQAEVNKQTVEYNRLLRAGASREILDAQLAKINAAEENMRASMGQVGVEEEALKTAKERQQQLEDDVKLQKDLVDQLLGVNDALTEQEKKEKAAKEKKGLRPLGEAIIPSDFAITSSISEAIDKAKAAIKEKMREIFQPLSDAWIEIQKDLDDLGKAWEGLTEKIGLAWDALKEKYPILQDIEDWLNEGGPLVERTGKGWEFLGGRYVWAWDEIEKKHPQLGIVHQWLTDNSPLVRRNGENWEFFGGRYAWAWSEVEKKHPLLKDLRIWIDYMPQRVSALADKIERYLTTAFQNLANKIAGPEDSLLSRWKELGLYLENRFWPWMRDEFWPKLVEFADKVVTPLEQAVGRLADSFQWWYDKIVQLASQAVTDALEQINRLLDFVTGHSPSPLEKGLKGVNQQLQVLATTRLPSIASMGPQMQRALAPTQMLSPVSNTSIVNNLGGNSFYGAMGMAEWDARTEQSLRRVLRRR